MSTVAEAIKRLGKYNFEDHVAVSLWQTGDVLCVAEERGMNLTQEQANDILDNIERQHNATIGINWDVIGAYLDFEEK